MPPLAAPPVDVGYILAWFDHDVAGRDKWEADQQKPKVPEWWLWAAVFEDAITIYREGLAGNLRRRREYIEAVRWIFNPCEGALRLPDFEAVCEILGYDAEWIRRKLGGRPGGIEWRR